jgi:hypothetical protein
MVGVKLSPPEATNDIEWLQTDLQTADAKTPAREQTKKGRKERR